MAAPLPIAWLDGEFLPLLEARISPLDRGFLFADSVYEVLPVYDGRPFLFVEHIARLERSLGEIRMSSPMTRPEWAAVLSELAARNGGGEMSLYVQVTRGAEEGRNHALNPALRPTVFMMASPLAPLEDAVREHGVGAVTMADERWGRCDIKSTALLANVLAKSRAVDAGATEAILLAGDTLREGSSSSVMVVKGGVIHAPPYGPEILPGTTRELAVRLAARAGIEVRVQRIDVTALREADEVMLSFATRGVLPVTRLDGAPIGSGRPGPVWQTLSAGFEAYRREVAGTPLLPTATLPGSLQDSPLEFPADHEIKVMGRATTDFRARMDAVVKAELGPRAADHVSERTSGKSNFISLTYLVHVASRDDLERTYRALHATGLVVYAL
jgi:D-alanine transaminase